MKKNIITFASGLVTGFILFWSGLLSSANAFLYKFFGDISSNNQATPFVFAVYFSISFLVYICYFLLARLRDKGKEPFSFVAALLFAAGFVLPLGLLLGAIAIAFSEGFFKLNFL